MVAGWLVVINWLFDQGYWLSAVLPLAAAMPPATFTVLILQSIAHRQTKTLTIARAELSRFQAPALARMIAKDPTFLLTPVTQEAAILFVDLSGFTGLSERLGPAATRSFLKTYHTKIVELSDRNNAVVLDFMGDGTMIGFGIPEQSKEDATNALAAALDIAQTLNVWIKTSNVSTDIKGLRIGAHIGPIILSRLGHQHQQQIAATGDCVNVASRLMDVGKELDALVTASTTLVKATSGNVNLLPPSGSKQVAIHGRQKEISVAYWRAPELIDQPEKN